LFGASPLLQKTPKQNSLMNPREIYQLQGNLQKPKGLDLNLMLLCCATHKN
jgi:hypothetical protein